MGTKTYRVTMDIWNLLTKNSRSLGAGALLHARRVFPPPPLSWNVGKERMFVSIFHSILSHRNFTLELETNGNPLQASLPNFQLAIQSNKRSRMTYPAEREWLNPSDGKSYICWINKGVSLLPPPRLGL